MYKMYYYIMIIVCNVCKMEFGLLDLLFFFLLFIGIGCKVYFWIILIVVCSGVSFEQGIFFVKIFLYILYDLLVSLGGENVVEF